jgi:hypothetical protein
VLEAVPGSGQAVGEYLYGAAAEEAEAVEVVFQRCLGGIISALGREALTSLGAREG